MWKAQWVKILYEDVHISLFLKCSFGFQKMVGVDRKSQKEILTNGLCIKIHMQLKGIHPNLKKSAQHSHLVSGRI